MAENNENVTVNDLFMLLAQLKRKLPDDIFKNLPVYIAADTDCEILNSAKFAELIDTKSEDDDIMADSALYEDSINKNKQDPLYDGKGLLLSF